MTKHRLPARILAERAFQRDLDALLARHPAVTDLGKQRRLEAAASRIGIEANKRRVERDAAKEGE